MTSCLINLERRPDRLAQARAEFNKQSTFTPTVWAATDGVTRVPEIVGYYDATCPRPRKGGKSRDGQ